MPRPLKQKIESIPTEDYTIPIKMVSMLNSMIVEFKIENAFKMLSLILG